MLTEVIRPFGVWHELNQQGRNMLTSAGITRYAIINASNLGSVRYLLVQIYGFMDFVQAARTCTRLPMVAFFSPDSFAFDLKDAWMFGVDTAGPNQEDKLLLLATCPQQLQVAGLATSLSLGRVNAQLEDARLQAAIQLIGQDPLSQWFNGQRALAIAHCEHCRAAMTKVRGFGDYIASNMRPKSPGCPSDSEIALFAAAALPPTIETPIGRHVLFCPVCLNKARLLIQAWQLRPA